MAKSTSIQLANALGLGMRILSDLIERIESRGGDSEVLALMTKERFRHNLDGVASYILSCDWQVSVSEVQDLAEQYFIKDQEPFSCEEERISTRNFYWIPALTRLGIEFDHYGCDGFEDYPGIPVKFLEQLDEKTADFPLTVSTGSDHDNSLEEYIVVEIDVEISGIIDERRNFLMEGDVIDSNKIRYLSVAKAKYFDFDQ